MTDSTLTTIADDIGSASAVIEDVVGVVAGLFPGAGSVFTILKVILQIASAAPTVAKELSGTTPVIAKLAEAAVTIMQAKTQTPAQQELVNAAQSAFAMGLSINSPEAKAMFPALNQ